LFVSYYPIEDGHGIDRIACVLQDVTERKQAEQALRESQAEVARVTRALTMVELAASIAHEVNQPLTAVVADVSASLRWLTQDPPDLKEVRMALLAAVHNANRASGIVAGVRARLQHTAPPLQRLEPSRLILDVLAMVREALVDSEIDVTTELAPNTPRILGNRLELEQVVLNLIMNAIDSMKAVSDRPRELLVTSSKDPEGVLIQIRDNGVGLDPTWADRMFEPLFTTKPTGIGMGLSISRSIVEGHGGRLWATPNSPHGASFQFTLQLAEEYHRG
jgi:C4-dicarboxylate-specific signal transduction histidine kinase